MRVSPAPLLLSLSLDAALLGGWGQSSRVGSAQVGCSELRRFNLRGCNGLLHFLQTPLSSTQRDVFGVLSDRPQISIFTRIFRASAVFRALDTHYFGTIFAPTDVAMAQFLPRRAEAALLADRAALQRFVRAHILPQTVCCASLNGHQWFPRPSFTSLGGQQISSSQEGPRMKIDGAFVLRCDIPATNGLVHIIDMPFRSAHIDQLPTAALYKKDVKKLPQVAFSLDDVIEEGSGQTPP